jgi:predicted CoA-binding protein
MNSTGKSETVVVLGATPKEDRYANMAQKLLKEHGHHSIPVNPAFQEVLGEKCYASIADVPGPIDTLTMYLGEARSTPLIADILAARPRRIIFNPGAENPQLAREAQAQGIEALEACTLVMLRTGQF